MAAITGETDVLNYLLRTGPISIADLALRFEEPPTMVRALQNLRQRREVDILMVDPDSGELKNSGQPSDPDVLDRIIDDISSSSLQQSPEARTIVRLTDKGVKRAAQL